MCERQFAMLEGLCHCGELLREAMREATFPMFHRFTRVDLETFLGLVFGCLGVWVFWFGCLLLVSATFSRSSSSFAKSNDRRSCHGAHGMGEKKNP